MVVVKNKGSFGSLYSFLIQRQKSCTKLERFLKKARFWGGLNPFSWRRKETLLNEQQLCQLHQVHRFQRPAGIATGWIVWRFGG
jgi:hypothetical protein